MAQTKTLTAPRISLNGAQLPSTLQQQPYGSGSLPSSRKTLNQNPASVQTPGPAQAKENFSAKDIPLEVGRALNRLQSNVLASVQQVKSDPTACKQLIKGIVVAQGTSAGGNPTVVLHNLNAPYSGYRINAVRNGYITGHAAIAPDADSPSDRMLLLWTNFKAFSNLPVLLDLEVYA